jgi:DNA invertase Pin-like site-specific DNA recombinase
VLAGCATRTNANAASKEVVMSAIPPSSSSAPSVPAVEYIRMSTEHQQYSTENQADVIREYAARRGFEIVKTYADEGKSGLRIEGRAALRSLISDVQSGQVSFRAILVYDVSRWGRFQDTDESAYYEYICRQAGIQVIYCAEQFENDGSPTATIIKSVKRAMAGEYSRELSSKVFKGQCRLIQLGYRQGGPAGYGLRRMLIDQNGKPKGELRRGEHKSLQTDRVILVPGPAEEVKVVRWIYRTFVHDGKREQEIAEILCERGVPGEDGRQWTRAIVHQILTNEKYIGNNIYNRFSSKLKRKRVRNSPEMWVRRDGAFEQIIDAESFFVARGVIQERGRVFSNEEMIQRLRSLLVAHSHLSATLIDQTDGVPSSSAYRHRFGSLLNAYKAVGYDPGRDFSFIHLNRRLRELYPDLLSSTMRQLSDVGATVSRDEQPAHVRHDIELAVTVEVADRQVRGSKGVTAEVIGGAGGGEGPVAIAELHVDVAVTMPLVDGRSRVQVVANQGRSKR